MRQLVCVSFVALLLAACSSEASKKETPAVGFESAKSEFAEYFYPEYKEPKVYIFRDSVNPLMEQYHRVYAKTIMEYRHNILEIYQAGGRFGEAYTYKLNDSLTLMAHVVFDRNKNKEMAEVLRSELFPLSKSKSAYFVSRFKGPIDSTMMLAEVQRSFGKGPFKMNVLGKERDVIMMNDAVRQTVFNPFTKQEKVLNYYMHTIFAKHLGAVAFYTDDKKLSMKVEKIVNDKQWTQMMKQ